MTSPADDPPAAPREGNDRDPDDGRADRLARIDERLFDGDEGDDRDGGVTAGEVADLAGDLDVIFRLRAAGERKRRAEGRSEAAATAPLIGRFRLRGELGRGGFAIVYDAFDPRLERRVALKVVRPEALVVPGARERFLREAALAARIQHPHVVIIHEVGEADGLVFMAQELCAGGTLAEWLAERPGAVPPRLAATIVRGLAEAAAAAHTAGVVHRDITPDNVFLAADPEGMIHGSDGATFRPKLGDFGLGAPLASADGSRFTRPGALMGTPSWMAPEQVDSTAFGPVGPSADVHALGLLLDRLLTGLEPHAGRSGVETFRAILLDEPQSADRVRLGLPRDLVAVALKARAKRPAGRYPDAGALAADLGRCLDGRPTVARPRSRAEHLWHRVRRNRVALATGVVLLSTLLGAAGAWRQHRAMLDRDARLRQQARADAVQRAFGKWQLADVAGGLAAVAAAAPHDDLAARWLEARTHAERELVLDRGRPGTPLHAERADLYSIGVGPDGRAGFGGADGTLFLASSGGPVRPIPAHDEINDVAFAPHGSLVATAGEDAVVRLWDSSDGAAVATIPADKGVFAVAFSPSAGLLAFGGRSRTLWIQPLGADGIPDGPPRRHEPFPHDVAVDGPDPSDIQSLLFLDDRTIAVASGRRIAVVDADTGRVVREMRHDSGQVGQLSLAPDGVLLLAAGTDRTPRLWDWRSGSVVRTLALHPERVQGCAFSPDGSRIATGCRDGVIRLFDATSGAETGRLVGHRGRTWDIAWEPSGSILSSGADGTVRRWDGDGRSLAAGWHESRPTERPILAMAMLGGGDLLLVPDDAPPLVLGAGGSMTTWPADVRFTGDTRAAAMPGGGRVAIAGVGPTRDARPGHDPGRGLVVLAAGRDRALETVAMTSLPVQTSCTLAADGTPYVGDSGRLLVWPDGVDAPRPVASFGHPIDALDFSARPRPRIALGVGPELVVMPIGRDGTPDAVRSEVVERGADSFGRYFMAVAWSPDATRIAAGIRDREVRVYDVADRRLVGTPVSLGGTPRSILWSAAGGTLVIADADSVTLCDADTGTKYDEIRPGWRVMAIALDESPGGGVVIAGGNGDGRLLRLPFGRD